MLAMPAGARDLGVGDITQWLAAAHAGDRAAMGRVFDCLYPELRRLARTRVSAGERTLTPTVLVHEAFLRLIGNQQLQLENRRHFMACAARAMRAIAIDHARRRSAAKRGGPDEDLPLELADLGLPGPQDDQAFFELNAALERLETVNARQCEVVELRYFAGLEFSTLAELLDCSERTVKREWERARAFLYAQLR
jgi:RNA polymerase sigma factor (TIGR02999 family)